MRLILPLIAIFFVCVVGTVVYQCTYYAAKRIFASEFAKCVGFGEVWGKDVWIYKTSNEDYFIMERDR